LNQFRTRHPGLVFIANILDTVACGR